MDLFFSCRILETTEWEAQNAARLFNLHGCDGVGDSMWNSTNGAKAPPKFDSGGYAAIAMNARRLEIVENWQMPMEAPYIGHFQTPYPSNIVAEWAASVLQPAGGSGELILDISKASVTKEKLPRRQSAGYSLGSAGYQNQVELVARLMWLQPVGGPGRW